MIKLSLFPKRQFQIVIRMIHQVDSERVIFYTKFECDWLHSDFQNRVDQFEWTPSEITVEVNVKRLTHGKLDFTTFFLMLGFDFQILFVIDFFGKEQGAVSGEIKLDLGHEHFNQIILVSRLFGLEFALLIRLLYLRHKFREFLEFGIKIEEVTVVKVENESNVDEGCQVGETQFQEVLELNSQVPWQINHDVVWFILVNQDVIG